ncbi:uncharacterized protein LOC143175075 isoform X2 [Nomia melanderi]|uniref:uncharacterized protein LOC143175075 isoform X2 n=1 Tax=Nomia melanderi TaxID=2448451 RepID=UPI003FCE34DD
MDVFQKNYRAYCSVMYITGLWPYDNSIVTKIQRVLFCVLTLSSMVIQEDILKLIYVQDRRYLFYFEIESSNFKASTIRMVETTVENVLVLLSFLLPTLLFFLRYVGYLSNFPTLKFGFENIQNDCMRLKDTIEVDLLMKEIGQSKRVLRILIVLSCVAVIFAFAVLVVPTILQSKLQIHYLRILGFFFNQRGRNVDFVCCNLALVTSVGVLSLSCTEAIPTVFGCYISGLFQITSYRMENAINRSAKSDTPIEIDVQSAVEMHQRALDLNEQLISNMMLSYLAAILAVVISFAVNLYRIRYVVVLHAAEIAETFAVYNDEEHKRSEVQSRRLIHSVLRRIHNDDELVLLVFYRHHFSVVECLEAMVVGRSDHTGSIVRGIVYYDLDATISKMSFR